MFKMRDIMFSGQIDPNAVTADDTVADGHGEEPNTVCYVVELEITVHDTGLLEASNGELPERYSVGVFATAARAEDVVKNVRNHIEEANDMLLRLYGVTYAPHIRVLPFVSDTFVLKLDTHSAHYSRQFFV